MLDLEIYTDKFAESGRRLVRKAYDEARNRDHNQITYEHVLISIAKITEPLFIEVMQSINLDPQVVVDALDTQLDNYEYFGSGIMMAESFRTLLANALKNAQKQKRRLIELEDMFIALFKDEQGFPVKLFQQLGVNNQMVIQNIQDKMKELGSQLTDSQNPRLVFRKIQRQNRNKNGSTRIILKEHNKP